MGTPPPPIYWNQGMEQSAKLLRRRDEFRLNDGSGSASSWLVQRTYTALKLPLTSLMQHD